MYRFKNIFAKLILTKPYTTAYYTKKINKNKQYYYKYND